MTGAAISATHRAQGCAVTGRLVEWTLHDTAGERMVSLRLQQPAAAYTHQAVVALWSCGSDNAAEIRRLDLIDRLEMGRTYRVDAAALAVADGTVWAMGACAISLLPNVPKQAANHVAATC
jgi:hypothetical protein